MQRQPLGDGTVHIGGPDLVANAGRIEMGGPAQGPIGEMRMLDPASSPIPFPGSPGVGSLQVEPILYDPNYSAVWPTNGGEDAWKGDEGADPNPVII